VTYFSAIPVPETKIGIAFEVTRGTAVEPEYAVPIMGPKYKPDLQLLPDEGLRGSMVNLYDEVPGLRYDGHGWDQYPYLDTFPVFLAALLGSKDTKTAAPSNTETVAEAKKAATHILTKATIATGSYVVIGAGVGTQETHETGTPVELKAEEFEIPLVYPLAYTHLTKAAVTGLTKHQFSLLNNSPTTGNQPLSLTITDYDGEEHWRALTACQLDSINLSGSAESLPKAALTWFANAATEASEPSLSYSTAEAPPGWSHQVAINGTPITYVVSWEYDLKRNVKNVPAITGTQAYYQHFAGALVATAKIVVLEDPKATWLTAYENGEQITLDQTLSDVESGFALNIHSTKAKFTSGEIDRSKEWVEVPLDVQLIPSSTDALAGGVSPVIATVANATTTEYA
jgi:hypothetical protein